MFPNYPLGARPLLNQVIGSPFGLPFAIANWIGLLLLLAGFIFFLVTAWRFMRAHEQLSSTLKDISASLKARE